ncbi:DUF3320 domain-containing protein [Serratia ureilytica]
MPELKYAYSATLETAQVGKTCKYVINELKEWQGKIDPERFYIAEYDETLKILIAEVINLESPLLDKTLVQRIARVHGFSRAGRLIRERVMEVVDQNYHVATDHFGEDFIWLSEAQRADWNAFRLPSTDADVRQVDAIPSEELRALALSIEGENKVSEMAKSLGIKRLTSQARQRLESII